MARTLITFQNNWADEFDCQQVAVWDKSVKEVEKLIKDVFGDDEDEFYFGTNQFFTGEEARSGLKVEKISDVDADTLIDNLGMNQRFNEMYTYGVGPITHLCP